MGRRSSRAGTGVLLGLISVLLMMVIVFLWYDSLNTNNYVEAASGSAQFVGIAETVATEPATAPPAPTVTTAPAVTVTADTTPTQLEPTAKSYADSQYTKRAYLTFDDGPSENTGKIIEILNRYGIKATFFVVGNRGAASYKLITDSGNTIALHSMTHTYKKIYKSTDAYFADLDAISKTVKDTTGVDAKIIRFPGGSSNTVSSKYCKGIMKTLVSQVEQRGYTYFDWNCDSGDAEGVNIPASQLLENVKNTCGGQQAVNVLMHDAGSTKLTTIEALPSIIEYFISQGYTLLPITAETEPVHHYVR